jgi:hypothetical protein
MKNGMCRASGMCGVEEKCIQGFSRETIRKEVTWKTGWEVVEWIDVALDKEHVAGCHEQNSAHLKSKNARGFLGYPRTY